MLSRARRSSLLALLVVTPIASLACSQGDDGADPTDEVGVPTSDADDETGATDPPPGPAPATIGLDDPAYEGVPIARVPKALPAGCVGGGDASTHTLTLTLDPAAAVVAVSVDAGVVFANGTACSAVDGSPASTAAFSTVVVQGTGADDVVIVDMLFGAVKTHVKVLGGAGKDAVVVRGSPKDDHVTVGAAAGAATIDLDGDGKTDVELDAAESVVVSTGPGNDVVGGATAALPMLVYGGDGDDVLRGGLVADVLNGGNGDDRFDQADPGNGADVMNGGAGVDVVGYERRRNPVSVTLCASKATDGCTAAAGCACAADDGEVGEKDLVTNVENIQGGMANDTLVGDAADNELDGNAGDDKISGGPGNDTLFGDDGVDHLVGNEGDDYLDGAKGVDDFDGGPGDGDICVVEPKEKVVACELF